MEDLDSDNGMATVMTKLDDVFLKEEKDRTYSYFDGITKNGLVSMADYIIDFEQRYNRMKKYDMMLPDTVLAFKLLDKACLDEKNRQLLHRVEVFIHEVGSKTDFLRKIVRLVKWNTSERGIFHRTKTTRKRKTERNISKWTTKPAITRD